MCGIFGYYSHNVPRDVRSVLDVLFQGLRRLEYRGYDSAGFCIDLDEAKPPQTPERNDTSSRDQDIHAPPDSSARKTSAVVLKSLGNIDVLEQMTEKFIQEQRIKLWRQPKSHVVVSHTRWATHGAPSAVNAHPHVSDDSHEFVVVHNGIISNYAELRDWLSRHGEGFVSETDTEVIPKLCRYVYHSIALQQRQSEGECALPFPRLVMEVTKRLEGAYALLIRSRHYPGELIACKRGSPLICGFGIGRRELPVDGDRQQDAALNCERIVRCGSFARMSDSLDHATWAPSLECWIASDASAVVEHTKKVVVLEDGDVMHACGGGWGIYNSQESGDIDVAVSRSLQTLQVEIEQILKGGNDHYMQKEIHEQPASLVETMRGRVPLLGADACRGGGGTFDGVAKATDAVVATATGHGYGVKLGGLTPFLDVIRRSRRIVFVACGTSYHACLAARSTVERLADMAVVLELASDLLDRQCPIFRDDTCVFVSQSGETADTLQALKYAKSRGALCVGITNTVGSAISRATDCGIHQNAGFEIGVASTKAYTSQIVCMTLMALSLSGDSISKRMQCDEVIRELGALPENVRRALKLDNSMRKLAMQVNTLAEKSNSLLFFGRGANYATALEAGLKMKEVALIHSEGILAGEMKHGPLALVDETVPIIVIATIDAMYDKMQSVLQQLLARNARLVVICTEGDESMRKLAQSQTVSIIEVPRTCNALQPIINIIPMQLLAYHLAVSRGLNVDQPRNLAKSVTVAD